YYERIMIAEESFLLSEFGEHYSDWAAATPAFIPAPRLWRTPRRAFSMKKVLANESPTLAQIVVVVTLIQLARDWVLWGRVEPSGLALLGLSGLSLVAYVVLRAIRKNTRWLSTTSDSGTAARRARPVADRGGLLGEDGGELGRGLRPLGVRGRKGPPWAPRATAGGAIAACGLSWRKIARGPPARPASDRSPCTSTTTTFPS